MPNRPSRPSQIATSVRSASPSASLAMVACGSAAAGRVRQLPAVDLAIRQQWQAGQLDETTRDEVLWQPRGEQLTPTVHAARIPGDNEGGQRLAVVGSTCHDRRLFDAGMLEQNGLDLSRFDAIPAQLDLIVVATQEEQPAVLCPRHAIAGSVASLVRARTLGILEETFGGEVGPAPIAVRDRRASDPGGTRDAGRNVAPKSVAQRHADAGNGPADRDRRERLVRRRSRAPSPRLLLPSARTR